MKYFTREWVEAVYYPPFKSGEKERSAYRHYFDSVKDLFPSNFSFFNVSMHDCTFIAGYSSGRNYIFEFDSSNGFSPVKRLIFVNAKLVRYDDQPSKRKHYDWEVSEIYITDGRYEVHILAIGSKLKFCEFIIQADDIVVEEDEVLVEKRNRLLETIRRDKDKNKKEL